MLAADIPQESSSFPILDEEITDSEQLRVAKERLITLYRLQEILRSTTDEKKLLRRVLSLLFQVLPVDRGAILVRDQQEINLFNPLAVQVRQGLASQKSIGISKTILMRCLKEKVAILTRDAAADDRFRESDSVVSHRIPKGVSLMYHSQDRHVNVPRSELSGTRGGTDNSVTRISIKPTLLVGGYAQLSWGFNYYGPTGPQRDEIVVVRKLQEVVF